MHTHLLFFWSLTAVGLALGYGTDQDEAKAVFRTAAVKRGTVVVTARAMGTLQPEEVVDVGAQVGGQIEKLGGDPRDARKTVDYGTPVEAGTVLAQLGASLYRNELERA